MCSHFVTCDNFYRVRGGLVCGYASSTFFASETPFSFVARPMPRHHQRRNGSFVVCADAVSFFSSTPRTALLQLPIAETTQLTLPKFEEQL